MKTVPRCLLIVLAVAALAAGCTSKDTSTATVAPTPAVTMSAFAGSWGTPSGTSTSGPVGSCSGIEYSITRISDTSGTVTYSGTCSGVSVTGTGQASLAGDALKWSASGSATRGSLNCPFQFTDSTATQQGNGILVNYNGTVCGMPVQGSQLLQRR